MAPNAYGDALTITTTTDEGNTEYGVALRLSAQLCGNGVREGSEECDGLDLGGATCASLGLGPATGTLGCSANCTFSGDFCSVGLLKDINPGSAGGYPSNLTNVNGVLYFTANDGTHGTELWKSDGTAAGTAMVKDIYPGSGSGSPSNLTNVNGVLYFSANDGTHGTELWSISPR
jgi:ELWxxDGT repeat protein